MTESKDGACTICKSIFDGDTVRLYKAKFLDTLSDRIKTTENPGKIFGTYEVFGSVFPFVCNNCIKEEKRTHRNLFSIWLIATAILIILGFSIRFFNFAENYLDSLSGILAVGIIFCGYKGITEFYKSFFISKSRMREDMVLEYLSNNDHEFSYFNETGYKKLK